MTHSAPSRVFLRDEEVKTQTDALLMHGGALTKKEPAGRIENASCGWLLSEPTFFTRARVAELADALASGASDRKVVEVRVLSRAPKASLLKMAWLAFQREIRYRVPQDI